MKMAALSTANGTMLMYDLAKALENENFINK
jgi:hypothetical protein